MVGAACLSAHCSGSCSAWCLLFGWPVDFPSTWDLSLHGPPKRRPAAKKRPAARGEGAGGQQNPGESAGGAGEGGGATEAPKKRKKVEEEEEKEKEAEEGGQVAEEGAAARPTSIPNPTDIQPTSDYWIREGNMWKRVHVQPRKDLYVPQQTDDGPDLTRLVQGRRSIIRPMDGTKGHSVLDDWTTERQATFDKEWTGSTNFEEHPQLRSRREGNDVEEPPTHAHQSLWDLNRQEEEGDRLAAPLGQAWDVDFVSMEISANCIPILADGWEVGGRLGRSPASDFPFGLEISCSPFTLRVASIFHPSMTNEHESMLREAASKLRVFLQAAGVIGHPILAAPDTLGQQGLQLAKKERFCSGVQLGTAIEQCLPSAEWQLFVCRYGLKIEAGGFFGKLLSLKSVMEADLGQLRSRTAWARKVLDFGTRSILTGKVCLVAPSKTKCVSFLDNRKTSIYSLFGGLGGGFGGVEMAGADGPDVLKVIAYPGNYTHQMKAKGLPNAFAPRHAHQRWFAGQWGQVQACLAALDRLDDSDVAGLRVEIRCSSAADTWEDMEADLQHAFREVATALVAKEIEFQHIVEGAKLALGEAEAAGLFQCQGQSNNAAPGWKFHNWGRLMHHFGVSNKYTHRFALSQALKGAPWGPEGGTSLEEEAASCWKVNPKLPPSAAVIKITPDMAVKAVQAIGLNAAGNFDWPLIADYLGNPEAASLLQRVCIQMAKNGRQACGWGCPIHLHNARQRGGNGWPSGVSSFAGCGKCDSLGHPGQCCLAGRGHFGHRKTPACPSTRS